MSIAEIFPKAQYALIRPETPVEVLLYLIWYLFTPTRFLSIVSPLRGFNSTSITWWLILPDDGGGKINMSSLKARNFIPKARFYILYPVKNEELYTRIVDFRGDWGPIGTL